MATQLATITDEIPLDPDAQATVTDFLDYTEYLPSDLIRSLTLISKLDENYLSSANTVHDLTKVYGSLPTATGGDRPNPQELRQEVSSNLDYAIEAREASFAEAARLYEVVDRHYNRLTSIISKLKSLPKPPSRDPTPTPQLQTTHTSRVKIAAADFEEDTPPQRITLRFDAQRAQATSVRTNGSTQRSRYRNRNPHSKIETDPSGCGAPPHETRLSTPNHRFRMGIPATFACAHGNFSGWSVYCE